MRTAHLLMMIAAMTAPLSTACSAPAEPAALMSWPDLLDRPRPAPTRTIAYGADKLQVVDLWLPAGKAPHPVVLMIHGGCWLTDVADRTIMNWIADDLAKRGIAVWNIEYRGVDRAGGGYPGTFEDVAAAADLLARDGPGPGLGLATDTSPPDMPASGVDEVQVNGDSDAIAPAAFAADYAARRKAAGQTVRSVTVPRTGHVELIAPDTKAWAEQVKIIAAALRR